MIKWAFLIITLNLSCKTTDKLMGGLGTRLSDVLVSQDQWLNNLKFDIQPGVKVTSVDIKHSEKEGKPWIIRKGKSRIGNCIIERYPLVKVAGKHFLKLSGYGERCTGIGCENCSFSVNPGSCECEDIAPWRRCKYSKLKISDIIKLKE